MEVLIVLGVAGAVGGLIAVAVREQRKRERVWRWVARERDATFHEASGFLRSRPYAIEQRIGDVLVYLDTYTVSTGKSSITYTRSRARFPLPAGPRFKVYREGFFSSIGKSLGFQDVTLGRNADFDRHFMVKCDHAALVRAVWSDTAMQLMLQRLPNAKVESDGREIELTCTGALADPAQLGACLDVVGAIANADLFGVGALVRLPGATRRTITAVQLDPPIAAELGVAIDGDRVASYARGPCSRATPQLETVFDGDGNPAGEVPAGVITQPIARLLRRLGPGRLICADAVVTYWFPGIERDGERLLRAAKLVATFASGPGAGAYRS